MAQGSKSSYTKKQQRKASKIERSVKKSGRSQKTAERIAWATVNKQDGGAKGKKKSSKKKSAGKKKSSKKTPRKKSSKKATRKS